MNRIWNSIVGKLWATILLLVSFVLFIVTALLLEFFDNFHTRQAEETLMREAKTIGSVIEDHENENAMQLVVRDILNNGTNAMVIGRGGEIAYSFHEDSGKMGPIEREVLKDTEFIRLSGTHSMSKQMILPSLTEPGVSERYIVSTAPIPDGGKGVVLVFQSFEAIHDTTKWTTHIVLLSAFIAFILTTFFAFFLSNKITRPLRQLKEAAFQLSKGNFDARIPVKQNDEIGQLSTAFNQMGRQLKYNMELIKQDKEQLSSILTSMTDAVITFNRDHTILLSNPQAEKLLQKWSFTNPESDELLPREINHMLEHAVTFAEEVDAELELGGLFFVVTISPLYSKNSIRGAVAVLRDMTEQHQLDKLRSDFIANVSHELRTPISMLQGYSEAILDGVPETEEENQEMVKIIHDESQRMGRLVTDLLDLARMESGHMRLYKSEMAIVPFLERMQNKFTQVARDSEVTLDVRPNGQESLHIQADEDRIEQVFTNLVDNAIRHTPNGGRVTLAVEKYPKNVALSVIDTGSGIPEEDLPYVFERFYKADKARTRGKSGTGLGLAIAKNIVESHGGMISARRGDTGGTVFTAVLPLE
ncbi:sensor histidine kinase ResE [Sporosarcina sp. NCCP-2716]|uniref:ATP-binding protein n=1 Tax=Sporosarcina sp. NCCP-2716 TaxID=2943679 RepID=UPI00203EE94D|nr:ATP-binding protein [Sporosarcina sp. NCCP-2716]GKV67920.1 sensor histidine kinase ResE [Sporosarcina sp. NCCP-2716]